MEQKLIDVEIIPHKTQRYNTVGDWVFEYGQLKVNVSQMTDARHEQLIAIHEIVEAVLCSHAGVKQEEVDKWDTEHDSFPDSGASMPECPYFRQHLIASIVEQLVATELYVDWNDYEAQIVYLSSTWEADHDS